jgi:hypothetical protein
MSNPRRQACVLLRNGLRALFRSRGEMNRREKDNKQRHQQIDFHCPLRNTARRFDGRLGDTMQLQRFIFGSMTLA